MEGKHGFELIGAICTSKNRHTSYRESETGVNRKKWNERLENKILTEVALICLVQKKNWLIDKLKKKIAHSTDSINDIKPNPNDHAETDHAL